MLLLCKTKEKSKGEILIIVALKFANDQKMSKISLKYVVQKTPGVDGLKSIHFMYYSPQSATINPCKAISLL